MASPARRPAHPFRLALAAASLAAALAAPTAAETVGGLR